MPIFSMPHSETMIMDNQKYRDSHHDRHDSYVIINTILDELNLLKKNIDNNQKHLQEREFMAAQEAERQIRAAQVAQAAEEAEILNQNNFKKQISELIDYFKVNKDKLENRLKQINKLKGYPGFQFDKERNAQQAELKLLLPFMETNFTNFSLDDELYRNKSSQLYNKLVAFLQKHGIEQSIVEADTHFVQAAGKRRSRKYKNKKSKRHHKKSKRRPAKSSRY